MSARVETATATRSEVLKDVGLTLTSLVVVALVIFMIVSPPGQGLALTMNAESIPGDRAVIYGTVVDTEGKPVRGATVVVVHENGAGPEQVASVIPGPDGTFRIEITETFGTHRVIVSADAGTRTARDSISVDVQPGNAYGITAELFQRDYFVFLPISTY